MPRSRFLAFLFCIISLSAAAASINYIFIENSESGLNMPLESMRVLSTLSFYFTAIPVVGVSILVLCTGFHIGWTILTIKVVAPMPDIINKKDNSKPMAFLLCLVSASIIFLLIYGLYLRSYWAVAIPAALISLVVLGAVFWIGLAILTSRNTLIKKSGK